ncbi:MAG: RNA polymerase sigma factor [Clostridia bacterium]|nr:RNA polymerase sigma factor [Clostridia bacterium]
MKAKDNGRMSDGEIMDLYFARDERAIKETDVKYRARLLYLARNIVHDAQDAEECLNDTYVCVWNSIPPARPDSLPAFLLSIMRRTAINRYKAARRQKRVPAELVSSLSDFDDMLSDGDSFHTEQAARALGETLTAFTNALSDRRAYIFMSRYYLARPIDEIADKLGCSKSTVNKEIAAIKQELRQLLESEGYLK